MQLTVGLGEAEFDQAYSDHYPYVVRTIQAMVLDPHIAEDLGQETFVRAYRARHRYDRSLDLRPWLHTIAVNLARSHLRRARLLRFLPLPDRLPDDRWSRQSDPDLRAALKRLSAGDRLALILHYVHGFEYREVGRILGVPPGTVGSRIHRSRLRLRGLLEADEPGRPRLAGLRRGTDAPTA